MTVIDKLASSLQRADEAPNLELAREIVDTGDANSVSELVDLLVHSKSTPVQSDCIKVLYEVGEQAPSLLAPYVQNLLALLGRKNNRLQWGAMKALGAVTPERPDEVYAALDHLLAVADQGSVITKDGAVVVLTHLCQVDRYYERAFAALISLLQTCPGNQLPAYAEQAITVVREPHRSALKSTLRARLPDLEKASKQKRVEKVLGALENNKSS